MAHIPLERWIRWSGLFVAAGLIVQAATLYGVHPLAFVVFLGVGCPLLAIGVLMFLYALVTRTQPAEVVRPTEDTSGS